MCHTCMYAENKQPTDKQQKGDQFLPSLNYLYCNGGWNHDQDDESSFMLLRSSIVQLLGWNCTERSGFESGL